MKNLTNLQLNILTEAFQERLDQKKSSLKGTKAHQDLIDELKTEKKYKKVAPILQKAESLKEKIRRLEEEVADLAHDYTRITGKRVYGNTLPTVKTMDHLIESEAIKQLTDDYPSKRQIEREIILMNISRSKNILQDLEKKFGI